MPYVAQNVKSYVLTAASGSYADIFTALHAHFTSAPGFWQLKSGVASNGTAGQSFLITQKTSPTIDLNFRISAANTVAAVLDPLRTITNAGATGSAPVGASAQANEEISFLISTAMARGVYVIELQNACYIITWNTTYTAATRLMGGADTTAMNLFDDAAEALGLTGEFLTIGTPDINGTTNSVVAHGLNTGATNASIIKAGNAYWGGVNYGGPSPTQLSHINPLTTNINAIHFFPVYYLNGGLARWVGMPKHLAFSSTSSPSNPQQPARVIQSGANDWLHFASSTSINSSLIIWEKLVSPTKP